MNQNRSHNFLGNATDSSEGEALFPSATRQFVKFEEPSGDNSLHLRTTAQGGKALAGLRDEAHDDEKLVNQQLADQQRQIEQSPREQPSVIQPVSEESKLAEGAN